MLDHVAIPVRDLADSRRFYLAALEPLGVEVVMEFPVAAGFGEAGRPWFWLVSREPVTGVHVAFAAPDRATVDAFHAAALAAGGRDNGGPGLRVQYHPTYYGAYVLDPDGNNVEAVCHRME
jgi:catechol 2,3-dioxygenase-like lactoylglutathione lyase family enzyme